MSQTHQRSRGRTHACAINLMRIKVRTRLLLFLAMALLVGANESGPSGKTLAYFTATVLNTGNTISTVALSISTPSLSKVFDITSNMIPGDFQLKPIDIINGGATGIPQQDFTYSVINTNIGSGDACSYLDSAPLACGTPNPPDGTADTGAAFLLLRCTNSIGGPSVPCATPAVVATQVYPLAGAGTSVTIGSGLNGSTTASVASTVITVGGIGFTGGQLLIGSAFPMGGPDTVAGSDLQTYGVKSSFTDHLAAIVYLPSTAGNALADQTTTLTFTWTAQQRLGGLRP
jgi:hypothetical protein